MSAFTPSTHCCTFRHKRSNVRKGSYKPFGWRRAMMRSAGMLLTGFPITQQKQYHHFQWCDFRPIRPFVVRHRRCAADAAIIFYLYELINKVYIDAKSLEPWSTPLGRGTVGSGEYHKYFPWRQKEPMLRSEVPNLHTCVRNCHTSAPSLTS